MNLSDSQLKVIGGLAFGLALIFICAVLCVLILIRKEPKYFGL